ncbi:unnamed protein product, partial [marine sediment metagenome]
MRLLELELELESILLELESILLELDELLIPPELLELSLSPGDELDELLELLNPNE